MTTYTTKQNDMWDSIAYLEMGSVNHTDKLMNANPGYLNYFIFPAGVELTIPDVVNTVIHSLPPWREVTA